MPTRKRPKSYHHGDLREALVVAAIALLEEKGLASFTLRECARRAGVSHAAPAHHFATAADLLAEIAARGFERFVAALGEAADAENATPVTRLAAMGQAYVAFALANPAIYGLMFRGSAGSLQSPHLKSASTAAWQQLCDAVAAALGPRRQDEVVAKAAAVWALVHGTATLMLDCKLPPVMNSPAQIPSSISGLLRSS
ncbi:TetR/AcrR family transcriptional regulator [Nordella sp. HKS 07]|uniref:TetR/AcrR family transcriptional regulator n=1 Tax=Nordella sp. HKS 07 TaxID=2712222 RepID=UPI0013E1B99D|nr:TetR/AcrR family transcriptional regulator [Nordella sp. HKS 07]QIG49810.1 TetR/AcrR family transcriptional regulator [Nordella sp. HKS 07]